MSSHESHESHESLDGAPVRRRRRREAPTRRVAGLVAVGLGLAGVIAAGLAVDRRGEDVPTAPGDPTATADVTPAVLGPVAPGAEAAGSTWYCAAGTAVSGGFADHTIVVANPGDVPVAVDITAFGGTDDPSVAVPEPSTPSTLEVPARDSLTLHLADLQPEAQYVGALVEAGAGEVVVEHLVNGTSEFDGAPCATSPSATWYLAAGATTRDARELLALFNPFPDDVIVDMTFTTPDGVRSPPELEGYVIPGQRVVVVDVGAIVSRHGQVSASIIARSGRLVVERLQTFDGTDPANPAGLALTPAAPAPALVWNMPDGRYVDGITETVTVYNPTDSTAEVDIEVTLAPSDDPTLDIGVEPFRLSVGPHGYGQVNLGAEPDRVPPDLGHATTVRSQNGVPVVAERWVRSGAPATTTGLAATLGSPVQATRWLFALGGTTGGGSEYLVIVNPSLESIARVTITAPTPTGDLAIADLDDVEVPVAGRVAIDLGAHTNRGGLALVIESTQPIVVERGLFHSAGGFSLSIAVPSGPTSSVPDVDTGGATAS